MIDSSANYGGQNFATPDVNPPVVLLFEEHEDTRIMLRFAIEMWGKRVVEAKEGERALDAANRVQPDLILLDGGLPLERSLSDARLLHETLVGRDVPIIFMSCQASADYRREILAVGCAEFLVKPVELDELNLVLDFYLKKKFGAR